MAPWKLKIGNTLFSQLGFLDGSDGKESACNAGDLGSIPGLGRSPREGNGYSLQCSCLENPMDRGAWWATVHRVAKSWTERLTLSVSFYFHNDLDYLKKITPEWVSLPSSWDGKNSAFEMTFQYESSGSEESEPFYSQRRCQEFEFWTWLLRNKDQNFSLECAKSTNVSQHLLWPLSFYTFKSSFPNFTCILLNDHFLEPDVEINVMVNNWPLSQ